MRLYRRSVDIAFDDGAVTIREISAGDLLEAEMNGTPMDIGFFFEKCAGVKPDEVSREAYFEIARAIIDLHPDLISDGDDDEKKKRA